MATHIATMGLGTPGGLLVTLGMGRTSLFTPRVPSRPIGLVGADPSIRVLEGAGPGLRSLLGADPALRTLEGADPADRILGS